MGGVVSAVASEIAVVAADSDMGGPRQWIRSEWPLRAGGGIYVGDDRLRSGGSGAWGASDDGQGPTAAMKGAARRTRGCTFRLTETLLVGRNRGERLSLRLAQAQ